MKLINFPETEIPTEFYIFVNKFNNITKLNLEKTKCISSSAFFQFITEIDKEFASKYLKGSISAFSPHNELNKNIKETYINGELDYLPFEHNSKCNVNLMSMFNNHITSEYRTEYNCEQSRKLYYPKYPSRLSSCYAFGDFESCKIVSEKYNWNINSVKKFKLIPHEYNRVAKVNMEIVSLERGANTIASLSPESQQQIWNSYWTGKGEIEMELPTIDGHQKFSSGIIWEYLVEGILELQD